jgi:hypothetical protein
VSGDAWLGDAPDDVAHQVWLDILTAHGRPDGTGPDTCTPAGEAAIFDDEDKARAAAADLHEAGTPLLQPEPCEHADHWHLVPAGPPTDPSTTPERRR